MPRTITTNRLTLRPPRPSDAADILRAVNDAEVTRWLSQVPYPYTLQDAQAFIARETTGETFCICIDDVAIGAIGTRGEFGYWLGRAYWGQGLATEASRAVVSDYFASSQTPLLSGHAVGNERSRRVLLKMGFEDTEIVDRTHKITGKVRKQQKMVLTADRWRSVA